MEQARHRLRPERALRLLPYPLQVRDEMLEVVAGAAVRRIRAVIAEIENDYVVAREHQAPEREVGIDCESVAVTQDYARSRGIAVAPHANDRAVVHAKLKQAARLRNAHAGMRRAMMRLGHGRE